AGNRLFYLATAPEYFPVILKRLGEAGLNNSPTGGWVRVIIEKPFGRDLASACELLGTVSSVFHEDQIYRIDHYLGKETVQNILVFRFGNAVFERVWNRDAIDHIQFTVAESIGIEGRGAFYEETGALRDILQNHVFQVLALLTMEPPSSILAEPVRDEKIKLFRAMRPLRDKDLVRGQYIFGKVGGVEVPGYREEAGVAPDSQTETYAAVKLHIDNWRWAGVPFFLRTGKHLPARATEVVISFRDVPIPMFADASVTHLPPNRLTILIQPEEEIRFEFVAKVPGPQIHIEPVTMQFSYGTSFKTKPAEAYERLLHDAMQCDPTLFARADSVERSWEVVEPVLEHLPPVRFYTAGTWGPPEADALIAPRHWVVPGYESQ
ncbi:MAG: glucose-6-phosphate dehydrogenase, partial [Tepidiformaceae bacterium]